jgi:methylated-DNA-[protein]-cysteine S-methyltransferase
MTTTRQPSPVLLEALRSAFDDPDVTAAARLHDRLSDAAERDGLLDVAYRVVGSPFGSLLLAATGSGLARVVFDREDHDAVLAQLATEISPRILNTSRRLDDAARQLDEYFAGQRRIIDVAIDLRLARGFRRDVLEHLRAIPYGTTRSYAAVAIAAGNPKAVRAVGSACSHNPLPVVVPCHRVVRSDGGLGDYLGGADAKRALLALEAAA